jgi:hypothetical protein
MTTRLLLVGLVACAPPIGAETGPAEPDGDEVIDEGVDEGVDTVDTGSPGQTLAGSPFLGSASATGEGGEGFVPYAFGFGADWVVAGGSVDGPAQVYLYLFTWSYLESGDPAGLCTVTFPVAAPESLVVTYDYATFTAGTTGPWTARGFTGALDAATATTDCVGIDPAAWGDPAALLDGTVLGVGVTVANDDVLGSLVPSGADLSRTVGAAVQWELFERYEDLSSGTYQVGATRYYADGVVTPGEEATLTGEAMPDGAYRVDPVLLLTADALLAAAL